MRIRRKYRGIGLTLRFSKVPRASPFDVRHVDGVIDNVELLTGKCKTRQTDTVKYVALTLFSKIFAARQMEGVFPSSWNKFRLSLVNVADFCKRFKVITPVS